MGTGLLVPGSARRRGLMADSYGYAWNNRTPSRAALRSSKHPRGMVQAGAGMMFEPNAETDEHSTRRLPSTTGRDGRLKGAHSAARASVDFRIRLGHSGLIAGRDPYNWITSAAAQQGMVAFRSRIFSVVPYAAGAVSFDSKRRTWENRVSYDAGVKLVRPLIGGVVEAGVAARRQHELLTGQVTLRPLPTSTCGSAGIPDPSFIAEHKPCISTPYGGSALLHLLIGYPRLVLIFGLAGLVGMTSTPHGPGRFGGTGAYLAQLDSAFKPRLAEAAAEQQARQAAHRHARTLRRQPDSGAGRVHAAGVWSRMHGLATPIVIDDPALLRRVLVLYQLDLAATGARGCPARDARRSRRPLNGEWRMSV